VGIVDYLIEEGWLKTERIIKAFREIDRRDFVPESAKDSAELNKPFSIGYGQTISQPLVVAFMLELLQPEKGNKILDIGSGSGWTTALLSYIVGDEGKVFGIEIVPELAEFGKKNILKYNFIKQGRAEIICANGRKGYEKEAPFDRILVSAEAEKIIPSWKKQLKIKGRIVAPVKNSIWLYCKKDQKKFEEKEYKGFIFVPLISN